MRLLLDRDDDGRLAHITRVAALEPRRKIDLRDLVKIDRAAVDARDN